MRINIMNRYITAHTFLVLFTLAVAFGLTAFPGAARAQDSANNKETVSTERGDPMPYSARKAENYLRGLKTAKANFIQSTSNGLQLFGTFYLDRPGRLRFEYDALDDFVVADGIFIYFYDSELEEQTNAPIGQTLADFLLRKDLRFSGDVEVTSVRKADNFIQISLIQADDPGAGTLILGFMEEPFQLYRWQIIDATGALTEVELVNLQTDIKLDSNLFVYKDPKKEVGSNFNE